MRAVAYKVARGAGGKIIALVELLLSLATTIWPTKVKEWANWAMNPDQIRLVGLVGIVLGLAYWLILAWLKPPPEPPASGPTTHGPNSPSIGSVTGNVTQNFHQGGVTTNENALRMRAETGSLIDFTGARIIMDDPAIAAHASDDSKISFKGARIGPPGSNLGDTYNIGKQPFEVTDEVADTVARDLGETKQVKICAVGSDESKYDAELLIDLLARRGITASLAAHFHNCAPPLYKPIEYRDGHIFLDSSK
jgi:hypothetical protein